MLRGMSARVGKFRFLTPLICLLTFRISTFISTFKVVDQTLAYVDGELNSTLVVFLDLQLYTLKDIRMSRMTKFKLKRRLR